MRRFSSFLLSMALTACNTPRGAGDVGPTRRLVLMRHAEASRPHRQLPDHARPLTENGHIAAQSIAEQLADSGWTPDVALVSDALRTEETWMSMASSAFDDTPTHLLPELYQGSLDDITAALDAYAGDERTVLLLGHQPGWEDAVLQLCGHSIPLATANAVLMSTTHPWPKAMSQPWTCEEVLTPR